MVCAGMKPNGVDEEQVKLKAFPFSLKGVAKAWLFSILPGSTWNGMKKIFLEKYFPASQIANIRKEICGIRQSHGETFSEYWERFKQLWIKCLFFGKLTYVLKEEDTNIIRGIPQIYNDNRNIKQQMATG